MELSFPPGRNRFLLLITFVLTLISLAQSQVVGSGGGFGNVGGGLGGIGGINPGGGGYNPPITGGGGFDQNIQPVGAGSLYTGTGTNVYYGVNLVPFGPDLGDHQVHPGLLTAGQTIDLHMYFPL
jgi:hypothetical protein